MSMVMLPQQIFEKVIAATVGFQPRWTSLVWNDTIKNCVSENI
jgi:hypothetical protein